MADWTFAAVYGSLTLLFLAASIGQPDPHPWIRAMGRLFTADTALSATLLLLAGLSLRRTRAIRVIAHALAYAMVLLPVGLWLFLLIAQRMAVTG